MIFFFFVSKFALEYTVTNKLVVAFFIFLFYCERQKPLVSLLASEAFGSRTIFQWVSAKWWFCFTLEFILECNYAKGFRGGILSILIFIKTIDICHLLLGETFGSRTMSQRVFVQSLLLVVSELTIMIWWWYSSFLFLLLEAIDIGVIAGGWNFDSRTYIWILAPLHVIFSFLSEFAWEYTVTSNLVVVFFIFLFLVWDKNH